MSELYQTPNSHLPGTGNLLGCFSNAVAIGQRPQGSKGGRAQKIHLGAKLPQRRAEQCARQTSTGSAGRRKFDAKVCPLRRGLINRMI